jgi:hypothetical protein
MYSNEELLTDERYWQLDKNKQSDLIAKHCAGIEERIRSASSRLHALRFKESECVRFEQSCPSALVRKALSVYLEDLISRNWGSTH